MSVWIMNIKDNRENVENKTKEKFEICKNNGFLAIGWVGYYETESDNQAFNIANDAIDSFKPGDLVWTKNNLAENESEKYYLCKITGEAQKTDNKEYNDIDIGKTIPCEFYQVEKLPDNIPPEQLIARHTIESANESITEKTVEYYKSIESVSNEQNIKKKKSKKKKKIIISVSSILVFVLVMALIFVPKYVNYKNQQKYPVLPVGLFFGMNKDDFKHTRYFKDAREYDDGQFNFIRLQGNSLETFRIWLISNVCPYNNEELMEDTVCSIYFNKKNELSGYTYFFEGYDYDVWLEVCAYFRSATGEGAIAINPGEKVERYFLADNGKIKADIEVSHPIDGNEYTQMFLTVVSYEYN